MFVLMGLIKDNEIQLRMPISYQNWY